jgi:2-methylcitrate dehydratase PrpD
MSDIAETVAGFVEEAAADNPKLRSKARILLVDALTLAISAREVAGITQLVGSLSTGTGTHLVWMTGDHVGAGDAALVNGICTHARFQDDTDMTSWSHPGSFVIPSAVAAAEGAGATLASLLDGLVVGYAVAEWSGGESVVAKDVMSRGFRGSPTFGPLASCAAACRVLDLSRDQIAHAIRVAAPLGRGTLHSVGAGGEDWRLHNGSAARDGLTAALAAGAGMQGGIEALEGPNGFLAAYAGRSEPPPRWLAPPIADSVLSVWHKALPTLGDNMAAALVAAIMHERIGSRTVDGVTVRMNDSFASYPGVDRKPPYTTFVQALASVQFAVARCLLSGTVRFTDYVDARDDRDTIEIANRTELIGDPALDYTEAEIVVHTKEGDLSVTTSELPRTLFYRDEEEAIRAATELLGERGRRLAERVLGAEPRELAATVITEAVAA